MTICSCAVEAPAGQTGNSGGGSLGRRCHSRFARLVLMRWALRKHGFEELFASMLRLVRACEDIAAETNSACEACVLTPVWTKLQGFLSPKLSRIQSCFLGCAAGTAPVAGRVVLRPILVKDIDESRKLFKLFVSSASSCLYLLRTSCNPENPMSLP